MPWITINGAKVSTDEDGNIIPSVGAGAKIAGAGGGGAGGGGGGVGGVSGDRLEKISSPSASNESHEDELSAFYGADKATIVDMENAVTDYTDFAMGSGKTMNTLVDKYGDTLSKGTQKYFQEKGIEEVTLYRGLTKDIIGGGVESTLKNAKGYNGSSWSDNSKLAEEFAGRTGQVLAVKVKVAQIVTSYKTFPGFRKGENEYILKGDVKGVKVHKDIQKTLSFSENIIQLEETDMNWLKQLRTKKLSTEEYDMPGWEQTENTIAYRIKDPDLFQKDSFRQKEINPGINLLLAKKIGSDVMETQGIRFDKPKYDLESAKKWYEEYKTEFEFQTFSLETFDIDNVEVFAVGKWNGDKYTEKDLANMVLGWNETKETLHPYVKLGHNEGQALAQKDGLPAVGWIENVRKNGKKLIVDIKNIPKKIYELIKTGAYKKVSSEVLFNVEVEGKKYPRLLKAIAFLGSDMPAVTNLDDILALYSQTNFVSKENEFKEYQINFKEVNSMEKLMELMKQMMAELQLQGDGVTDEAKAENFLQKLSQGYKQMKDENAAFQKASENQTAQLATDGQKIADTQKALEEEKKVNLAVKEEVKTLKGENFKFKEEKVKLEVTALVDKLVTDKKVMPAQRDFAFNILMDMKQSASVKKYKIGEKEMGIEETFLGFIEQNNFSLNTNLQTGQGDPQASRIKAEEAGYDPDSVDRSEKAKKYMLDHPQVGLKEALNIITAKKAS